MDAARIAAIWTELKECGDETQLGFPLSTIKVGELADLISDLAVLADTIERQAEQLASIESGREAAVHTAAQVIQERDAALAEVERLKGQVTELRDGFDAEQAGIELRRRQDAMGR